MSQQDQANSLFNKRLGQDVDKFMHNVSRKVSGIQTGIEKLDRQLLGLAGFVSIIGESVVVHTVRQLWTQLKNQDVLNTK
ncbi:hypothetical protein EB118_04280 [bacterium]|nr:hypothetical protein [bacterium]